MKRKELLQLMQERCGKTGYPFIAVVKYHRQAVPIKYGMETESRAEAFAEAMIFRSNVRWTEWRETC